MFFNRFILVLVTTYGKFIWTRLIRAMADSEKIIGQFDQFGPNSDVAV